MLGIKKEKDLSYVIETIEGVSAVRFIKQATLDDIKSAMDDLSIDQPPLRLWDFSCNENWSIDELHEIAEYGKRKFTRPAKVAIVAPADITFGLSRVHEIYRQNDILNQMVFRTEKEAIEWLKNQYA